jgi:putative peptide zinc metalloprotease protein
VSEWRLRLAELDVADRVEARIAREQLLHAEADLDLALKRRDELLVKSRTDGLFMLPYEADLPGRFVHKGDVLGYTAQLRDPVVRVIVGEDQAEFVRHNTRKVEVRFVDRLAPTLTATVEREVPTLSDTLPSMALSTMGGGDIVIDPTNPEQMKALARLLHLELKIDAPQPASTLGERVYVRFNHGYEPLANRMYRAVRRVFLKRFNV